MGAMSFSFDPAIVALIALATGLYWRAVHILAGRGYRVPRGQQAAWYGGIALTTIALVSPVDTLGSDLLFAHMGQHLLIGDLSAPLFLIGLRTPVYVFFLPRPLLVTLARQTRLRRAFRWLRRPMVAVPVWIVILYGWHIALLFDAASRHPLIHALQHESFVAGSLLVWWSVIEPKRKRIPADLWKVPYLIGARLPGMLLGMAFIVMSTPAYGAFYHSRAELHGFSPLTDQQVAGGMMMGLDLIVMLGSLAYFFYRSSEEAEQADKAERAAAAAG
jgi:cytochrome c oxidase assembly factor CtaG